MLKEDSFGEKLLLTFCSCSAFEIADSLTCDRFFRITLKEQKSNCGKYLLYFAELILLTHYFLILLTNYITILYNLFTLLLKRCKASSLSIWDLLPFYSLVQLLNITFLWKFSYAFVLKLQSFHYPYSKNIVHTVSSLCKAFCVLCFVLFAFPMIY